MKRDYNAAVKAAVNGLYSGTLEDMEQALYDVLEAIDANMAELMQDNPEEGHRSVNSSDDIDYDDDIEPLSLDDFEDE